jgi:hypothetical protein
MTVTLGRVSLILLAIFAIAGLAGADTPVVTITDPFNGGSEPGYESPTDYDTYESPVDVSGTAGIVTTITGTAVSSVNLCHWRTAVSGPISINVTQAAERAVLWSRDLSGGMTSAGFMYVNGERVEWSAGATVANLASIINMASEQTGVMAYAQGAYVKLQTLWIGGGSQVYVAGGSAFLPGGANNASDYGVDAAIVVTRAGQPITDTVWTSGWGLECHDSQRNTIVLAEPANSVGDKGAQISVAVQDIAQVTWTNPATGQSGTCVGTNAWSASGIALDFGENPIEITALDGEGQTGTDSIDVTLVVGDYVEITQPTRDPEYTTHASTIDIGGTAWLRSATIGSAVVSADLSHVPGLYPDGYFLGIDVTTAAAKASFVTDIDISSGICEAGDFYVNGFIVEYALGDTQVTLAAKVNAVSDQTGVVASVSGNFVRFESVGYGSAGQVHLTGMRPEINIPASSHNCGVDVQGTVYGDQGNAITDAVWNHGTGLTLKDSLGNTIELTEEAGHTVGDLGVAVWLWVRPVTEVMWRNKRTAQTGLCAGTNVWTANGIPLLPGPNTIRVLSTDPDGGHDMDELVVTYFASKTAGAARQANDGDYVSVSDVAVTASSADLGDCAFVEATDRASGMKATGLDAVRGTLLQVDGVITVVNGERVIQASSVTPLGSELVSVGPLGMNNQWVGGLNDGLLVRAWGKVKSADPDTHRFVIDDGSGVDLTCQAPEGVSVGSVGPHVTVTGISSFEMVGSERQRLIRVRDGADIVSY